MLDTTESKISNLFLLENTFAVMAGQDTLCPDEIPSKPFFHHRP